MRTDNHVPVRAKSLVWTKENLINVGFSRLPDDWSYTNPRKL